MGERTTVNKVDKYVPEPNSVSSLEGVPDYRSHVKPVPGRLVRSQLKKLMARVPGVDEEDLEIMAEYQAAVEWSNHFYALNKGWY